MLSICTICRHDLSGFPTSTLDCKHTFHSECILNHFRSPREWSFSVDGYGSCPLCRAGPLGMRAQNNFNYQIY